MARVKHPKASRVYAWSHEKDLGNDGENHKAKPDMHLLYGLADAVATIIAVTDEREKEHGS